MTIIEHGRLVHAAQHRPADQKRPGTGWVRTELVIAVVLAAWAIVLICGYIAAAAR